MKIREVIHQTFSRIILRNLILLVGLSIVLIGFPFREVWAGHWEVYFFIGCTNYTAPPNTPASCRGDGLCKYVLDGGGQPSGMLTKIWLTAYSNSTCSTIPAYNTARVYTYSNDPLFDSLYGEADSFVSGLPYYIIYNHQPCSADYTFTEFPFPQACPPGHIRWWLRWLHDTGV